MAYFYRDAHVCEKIERLMMMKMVSYERINSFQHPGKEEKE
jgi:hypothetical protein